MCKVEKINNIMCILTKKNKISVIFKSNRENNKKKLNHLLVRQKNIHIKEVVFL